jgi:hypothetical protein
MIMAGQQYEGWQMEVKTPAHSQNGRNYSVNEVYHVQIKNDVMNINSDLLCHGRAFDLDKNNITTTLKLSKLGAIPA